MKKFFVRTMAFLFLLMLVVPLPCFAVDYGAIQIDGYYDDWEDKPHTQVYYGTIPNVSEIHLVSLFRDETRVYIHVKMSENNYSEFHNMYFSLYTNAGTVSYTAITEPLSEKKKPVVGTAGLTVHLQSNWNIVGTGYYTRAVGESDDAEFVIPLSTISSQPASITEISLKIVELGSQQIFCVGADTAPYIGIAICAAIALGPGGYYYYRRKKDQC